MEKQYPIHDSGDAPKVLNEALVQYANKESPTQTTAMNVRDFFDNKMILIRTIRKGLPYHLFASIKALAPFTEEDWADYLNVSSKTLQRASKEKGYFFKPIHTEKILELAEVTQLGRVVFDSVAQFHNWLQEPSIALGNYKPGELLKDSYGKEMVVAELHRIDEGIFA